MAESLHDIFVCDLKISERAKLEAASFSDFRQKNGITEQTAQQWVCDVQQWAVTGKSCVVVRLFTNTTVNHFVQIWLNCVTYLEPGSTTEQGATEDLRAEIESIIVALLRKKQDLYRQNGWLTDIQMAHCKCKQTKTVFLIVFLFHFADSNQTRQRKIRKIRELKKKLKQKSLLYNTIAEDTIDEELASNLTEDYILPWERREDGMVVLTCSLKCMPVCLRYCNENLSLTHFFIFPSIPST